MIKKTISSRHIQSTSFLKNLLITSGILAAACLLCFALSGFDDAENYTPILFVFAVFVIACTTSGYIYGISASILGLFLVNNIITYPHIAFNFTLSAYPITFASMLVVSITTSALVTKLRRQEKIWAQHDMEVMRSNLLRAISHDLRTPLTSIIGSVSTVLEDGNSMNATQKNNMLSEVVNDARWLMRVVENLLSITRLDSDTTKITKHEEAAEEIISETVSKFMKYNHSVEITVSVPELPLYVPMDAMLIEQVLLNILENSVIHGKTTTRIELKVTKDFDHAVFLVDDDGEGIAPLTRERIFDGSLKIGSEKRSDRHRNMGIGLSVCKTIIAAHSGSIFINNKEAPQTGTVVWFSLPLDEEPQ